MKIFKFLLFIILSFLSEYSLSAYTRTEFISNVDSSISSGDVNRFINMVGDCKGGKLYLGQLERISLLSLEEQNELRIQAFKDALENSQNETYKKDIEDLLLRLVNCETTEDDEWIE